MECDIAECPNEAVCGVISAPTAHASWAGVNVCSSCAEGIPGGCRLGPVAPPPAPAATPPADDASR